MVTLVVAKPITGIPDENNEVEFEILEYVVCLN